MFVPKIMAWYIPQPVANRWSVITGQYSGQFPVSAPSCASGVQPSYQSENVVTDVRSSVSRGRSREFRSSGNNCPEGLSGEFQLARRDSAKSLMSQVSLPPEILENAKSLPPEILE